MNQEKIGKFLSQVRKEKNMTQKELADKLNVTDRAVGHWENGRRLPDYSIIKDLCSNLGITINELFAGEYLKEEEKEKHFDKNILEIFKFDKKEKKKYKIIISLFIIILVIFSIYIGKITLVKYGYLPNEELKYVKRYEYNDEIKGHVDYHKFESISLDFEIGANKYGYAVFKNPDKALKRLKKNYSKGINAIKKEFHLLPLSIFNFREYGTYGWQLTIGSSEEKEEARFVTSFFDIYENSFNNKE